jgi:hypothetical protein
VGEGTGDEGTGRGRIEAVAGIAAGVALAAAIGWFLWRSVGVSARPADFPERLAFAAKWNLVPALCVLVGVAMVANYRFFTGAVDPLAGPGGRTLAVWRHYLGNSLEQAVLAIVGLTAFACVAPHYWLKAIPIVAALFALGRVLFVAGYLIRPTLRAAGFTMTFYPIVALYGVTLWLYWFRV